MQQLYDGAEFDAYRELGLSAVDAALKGGLRPAHPRARWGRDALERWLKLPNGNRPAVMPGRWPR